MSDFQVGDHVRVIDNRGHGSAIVGSLGVVEEVESGYLGNRMLRVRQDGGALIGQFDYRFKKVEPFETVELVVGQEYVVMDAQASYGPCLRLSAGDRVTLTRTEIGDGDVYVRRVEDGIHQHILAEGLALPVEDELTPGPKPELPPYEELPAGYLFGLIRWIAENGAPQQTTFR